VGGAGVEVAVAERRVRVGAGVAVCCGSEPPQAASKIKIHTAHSR